MELFAYGQKVADKAGFILVDTKYEFGKTLQGDIILIDEVHTCDSSRYWIKKTYDERMEKGEEPEKLDKDCVRDWIKTVCDPYKDTIPAIPQHIISRAHANYTLFYDTLASVDLTEDIKKAVVILAGSEKDKWHVQKLTNALKDRYTIVKYHSAHKQTKKVLEIIKDYEQKFNHLIWVTVAGRSNALSGVVAANSSKPVIACPPFKNHTDMMINLHSSLQCPSKVPVMTILEPTNVALAVDRIFNL